MGYVGSVLLPHLRRVFPGSTLIGYDTSFFGHCLTGAQSLPEARIDHQFFGDIRAIQPFHLKGVDVVVHLAAISNDPMGLRYEAVTSEINFEASIRLANMAKQLGCKNFIFASSCSVYGSAGDGARSEGDILNPLTAYAKSKISTENQLLNLADSTYKVTSLRFATACGMSPRLRLDLVVNDFVACAFSSKKIQILSDGSPWRPLINVRDMARAIEWAIIREGEEFLAINIGSDNWNYQIRDLANAVAKILPNIELSINRDAAPDKRSYRVNFGLYSKLAPNHQPLISLDETIAGLIDGLASMNFNQSNFRDSWYMRLKVIEQLQLSKLLTNKLYWR